MCTALLMSTNWQAPRAKVVGHGCGVVKRWLRRVVRMAPTAVTMSRRTKVTFCTLVYGS
jgi:hypothetical protein